MVRSTSLALLSIVFLVACGPKSSETESWLMWGHLKYKEGGAGWFINVKPTDKIEVCTSKKAPSDEAFQLSDSSIRKWVKPMGRDKAIQIVKCGEGGGTKFKVDITLNSNDPDCSGNVLGWTMVQTGEMHICKSASRNNTLKTNVTLHEFGHMFGMCDQYSGGVGCDSANSGQVDNDTIMGNGRDDATDLIQDDIDGILTMANRSEFAATKKAWDDFLKNGGGTTPPGDTGGGGTTPGDTGGGGTTPGDTGGGGTTPPGDTSGGSVPTIPSSDPAADIFILFASMNASNPVGYIYMASNDTVQMVGLCKGDKATCSAPSALLEAINFSKIELSILDRRFFRTDIKVSVKGLSGVYTLVGRNASGATVVARQITLTPKTSLVEE